MPYDGNGSFSRVHDWTDDLANTVPITASRMDAEHDGFATGLSNCVTKDGQTTITANLPMNSKKLTGLAAGTSNGDSVRYEQVIGVMLPLAGGVMTGALDLGGQDLIIDDDGDSLLEEVSDDIVRLVTGGTEAWRVTAAQTMLWGKTSSNEATAGVEISSGGTFTITRAGGNCMNIRRISSNGQVIAFKNTAGTEVGSIATGSSDTTYNTTCDERVKDREAPINKADALARIRAVPVYRGGLKDDPGTYDYPKAHEVQAVFPDIVIGERGATDKEGKAKYQQWAPMKLIPTLMAALQQMAEQNEALEARIAALEGA